MQYAIAGVTRNSFGDLCIGAELTDVRDVIGVDLDVLPLLALDVYLEMVIDNGCTWTSYLDSAETVHGVPAGRDVLYLIRNCHGELTEVVLTR